MIKIYTTFRMLKREGACQEKYYYLASKLGGITKYGRDKPIPILTVLKHGGYWDVKWVLSGYVVPINQVSACRILLDMVRNDYLKTVRTQKSRSPTTKDMATSFRKTYRVYLKKK